jgi:AraC-like DNA-binding protein
MKQAFVLNRSSPATVMAAAAEGALERIAASGVDPQDVLSEVGLQSNDFADPTNCISLASYCSFFEIAARKTTRNSFGLEFGGSFHPQQLGMLGYLVVSSPTLGVALRKFAAYLPTHQQATRVALTSDPDGISFLEYVILDGAIKHRQQDAELSIAVLVNIFRHCLGSRWAPSAIHLMHAKPGGKTHYQEVFGTMPRFEQTSNRIIFRQCEMDCRMPRGDDNLMRLLESELDKRLSRLNNRLDVLSRARHEIGIAIGAGTVDLEQISRRCGFPPWTLKRRLKQQGLTFQQLVADTRYQMAIQQLTRAVPITDVAHAIGYSEVSAFSRAFREWTGLSPKKFLSAQSTDRNLDADSRFKQLGD